jgi:maleate isomerase
LMLSTEHTAELEFSRFVAQADVGIYTNRVPFANPTTPENLRAMLPHISTATDMLLPGSEFDVIYYGCTSASVVIGDDAIVGAIKGVKNNAEVITPTISAMKAFQALNVDKIALLTPYLPQTSKPMQPYFEECGLDVVKHSCLGMEDDRDMARLDRNCLIEAALRSDHEDADCLFISCTAVPSLEVSGEIENAINKPVVTSNQAAVWHCLGLLGLENKDSKLCRLFSTPFKNIPNKQISING